MTFTILKSDVENYLNITLNSNGQSLVDSLIPAVCEYIETRCNRSWGNGSGDIVETFDGGDYTFYPKAVPVDTITKIEVDGEELEATSYYNYGAYIQLSGRAINIPQAVKITFKTKATTPPASVKQAAIQWVADMFKAAPDAGNKASRVSTGPVSVDFLMEEIPAYVEKVIKLYRLSPVR